MRNYLKKYTSVHLPRWFFLHGETLTMDGTAQFLTIPADAEIIEIDAETAEIYYHINGSAHDATAPGFVPTNGRRILGPLSRIDSVGIWGTAVDGAVAHVQYFVER
jgi:hypothetical protein